MKVGINQDELQDEQVPGSYLVLVVIVNYRSAQLAINCLATLGAELTALPGAPVPTGIGPIHTAQKSNTRRISTFSRREPHSPSVPCKGARHHPETRNQQPMARHAEGPRFSSPHPPTTTRTNILPHQHTIVGNHPKPAVGKIFANWSTFSAN